MARKLQGNDAKNNELNLTPLIDAVFLLLVFFMAVSYTHLTLPTNREV